MTDYYIRFLYRVGRTTLQCTSLLGFRRPIVRGGGGARDCTRGRGGRTKDTRAPLNSDGARTAAVTGHPVDRGGHLP